MNLGRIRTIAKEDFKGKEIPDWIDSLLDPLNQFIEQVGLALQGRLTFDDNFFSKTVTIKLTHNTALEINPSQGDSNFQRSRVLGVIPIAASGYGIDAFKWSQLTNGNIEVTANFSGGTGTDISIKLLVLYQ